MPTIHMGSAPTPEKFRIEFRFLSGGMQRFDSGFYIFTKKPRGSFIIGTSLAQSVDCMKRLAAFPPVPMETVVPQYRVFTLDQDGHINAPPAIIDADDGATGKASAERAPNRSL